MLGFQGFGGSSLHLHLSSFLEPGIVACRSLSTRVFSSLFEKFFKWKKTSLNSSFLLYTVDIGESASENCSEVVYKANN